MNLERTVAEEGDGSVDLNRREFLAQMLGMAASAALPSFVAEAWSQEIPSRYGERGWFYDSLEEIANVYDQEYYGERQLQNVIRQEGGELRGRHNGSDYVIPASFIEEICRHCSRMLDVGSAAHLFRLDAFHNHLYLPDATTKRDYRGHSDEAVIARIFADTRLVALYHNYEHLKLPARETALFSSFEKRNAVGFFDGRPLQLLPFPTDKGTKVKLPMTDMQPYVKFAAHKDGLFSIARKGETIRLDVSIDDPSYY